MVAYLLFVIGCLSVFLSPCLSHSGHENELLHHVSIHRYAATKSQTSEVAQVIPVPLTNVSLSPKGLFYSLQQINLAYLLALDADNLLYTFRVTAGVPTPPGSRAYGGWESADSEVRGHFVGHFMSASARMWQATRNSTLKAKMDYMVSEFAKCQNKIGTGYLSGFPTSFFDRLEAHQPVWAPYYTIHKIMAGILDQYFLAQNQQALQIVIGMANYFAKRVQNVLNTQGMTGWQQILDNEWGGMNDVLYSLYSVTQDPSHVALANFFDHFSFTGPLASHVDSLEGLHANTHIPEVIGAQRGYEVTGNKTLQSLSDFFYQTLLTSRTYVTGGNNDYEYWPAPHSLGDTTNGNSQESCTQYNMIKLASHFFTWSANVSYANYIERALWGGIIGNMHHTQFGKFIYYQPLGGGYSKPWGDPYNSFWCCYGTMLESHAKLSDLIYFVSVKNDVLYVNQFIDTKLAWGNILVEQVAGFPDLHSTTAISISGNSIIPKSISVRVPDWATGKNSIAINGVPVSQPIVPNSYFTITRIWNSGDRIDVYYPMSLSISILDDKRERFSRTFGISYGPLTLAGIFNTVEESYNVTLYGDLKNPDSWISRISDTELKFQASGKDRTVNLIPLGYVVEQPYTVYFDENSVVLNSISREISGQKYYLRHSGADFYNNMIYLTPVNLQDRTEQNQATWEVLDGLASGNSAEDALISLAPFRFDPGFYLIHNFDDSRFTTQTATAGPTPWPDDFSRKASYWTRKGLNSLIPGGISFESLDFPGYFLSTFNQTNPCTTDCKQLCGYNTCTAVYLRKLVDSQNFKEESTFTWSEPFIN